MKNLTDKERADAWKKIAEKLYKAALCDCMEHDNGACNRCLTTVQAYHNLKKADA